MPAAKKDEYDYRRFFPFEKIRPEQDVAIRFILDSFLKQKKRFVIGDIAVGVGKSAIAITVSRYLAAMDHPHELPEIGSWMLTTQKVLQDQYVADFGPQKRDILRSIKSSSNFACTYYDDQSCGESRRLLMQLEKKENAAEFRTHCKTVCPYVLAKKEFIESHNSLTNFSYFLSVSKYQEEKSSFNPNQINRRQLLIVDEAHCVESEISKFVEVVFSERFAKDVLKCDLPRLTHDQNKNILTVHAWLQSKYHPALERHIKSVVAKMKKKIDDGEEDQLLTELSKQNSMLDKHICKLNRFLEIFSSDNWIMNVILPTPGSPNKHKKFEFKPIDVSPHCEGLLFQYGEKVLLLSATIIDKDVFCQSIGIDPKETAYIRLASPFPVENRPIFSMRIGKMSMKHIDDTLPKIALTVDEILKQHSDEKGIIHCTSFKVAKYVHEHVKSKRLLIHTSEDRDAILRQHLQSSEPTVLLSPSMMEGVDLADDASRFQILCKIPFPYLGDSVIQRRKEKHVKWYAFQTVKSIVQAMGRSIRNEKDHAVSYILDEDWEYFYKMNRDMFPPEFQQSIC